MRKFTKEIMTLLTTVAMGTTTGAAPAEISDEPVRSAGNRLNTNEASWCEPDDTTPFAGEQMEPGTPIYETAIAGDMMMSNDTYTTMSTTEPPFIGTSVATATSTTMPTTEPPFIGTSIATATSTTMPTTEPPFIGTSIATATSTTMPTTEPPFIGTSIAVETTTEPPFAGGMMVTYDGDVNEDGIFNISDVVTFQRHLLNAPDIKIVNWYAADRNHDGVLDVFDLIIMKRDLIQSL